MKIRDVIAFLLTQDPGAELVTHGYNHEFMKRTRQEERERCAKEVHQMWIDGFPAQEFADRLRRKTPDLT